MKTSAAGRALIEQREGRRLAAYRDTKGILTIGVGHTGRMSPPPVTVGMRISEAQCDAMLVTDLAPVEAVINTNVRVPLSQNEFDALASLGFNIGSAGLKRSNVLRKLNRGDVEGAAEAFMAWSKPAVLAARRREEKAQFLASDRTAGAGVPPVAPARAATLATMADAARGQARAAQSAGAASVVAGATIASTAQAHHHLAALGFGALAIAVGLCAALFVMQRQRAATILVLNAEHQMRPEPAAPSGVDLAQSLKQ